MRLVPSKARTSAFTLIEVLVVVAIIALLVAILIPSLARAREQAKRSVCLSNMQQHGRGFGAYSADHKGLLPWAGNFRYTLAEGGYYLTGVGGDDWVKVSGGALYPKYIGANPNVFYCPSNRDADADGDRGKNAFLNRALHPRKADPQYVNSHDAANSPIGAYAYALPVLAGKCPRDAGANMYPLETMKDGSSEGPYYQYMTDPVELTPQEAAAFLGPFPRAQRGKHAIHTLMTDAYFGGYQGYHLNGFNVMFGDMHARRIGDPRGVIINGVGGGSRYTVGKLSTSGKCFMVWDFFARQP